MAVVRMASQIKIPRPQLKKGPDGQKGGFDKRPPPACARPARVTRKTARPIRNPRAPAIPNFKETDAERRTAGTPYCRTHIKNLQSSSLPLPGPVEDCNTSGNRPSQEPPGNQNCQQFQGNQKTLAVITLQASQNHQRGQNSHHLHTCLYRQLNCSQKQLHRPSSPQTSQQHEKAETVHQLACPRPQQKFRNLIACGFDCNTKKHHQTAQIGRAVSPELARQPLPLCKNKTAYFLP